MNIPAIIHQVWDHPAGMEMPLKLQILSHTWKEKHPQWEYHLWNVEEMRELVRVYYPDFWETYQNFPLDIQRWDAIRYMILHQYGGVYVDLDTECLKPIDSLFDDKDMYIGEEPSEISAFPWLEHMLGNAFMASVPKCVGWLKILREIKEAIKRDYKDNVVLNTTGTQMISRIFYSLLEDNAVTISFRKVAPVQKFDVFKFVRLQQKQALSGKIRDAYCIHYFLGSWDKDLSIYK